MTSRDFCYWLQGYFEIEGNQPRPPEHQDSLNGEQIKMIRNHLAMVFKHEIDPSFGGPKVQEELHKIHSGTGIGGGGTGGSQTLIPAGLNPQFMLNC